MITRIGVIYQDANSLGFLRGLRDRLQCRAEFIPPPTAIGKTKRLPRRQAKRAWSYFRKKEADLVVRFTDADGDRWQDVQRGELQDAPSEAESLWVCGVAVNNPEEWLYLDRAHLAAVLEVPLEELDDPEHRTPRIKAALARLTSPEEGKSDVVARIVRDAPREVFRRWLLDDALRRFYTDRRAAAAASVCDTPNELEASEDE